MKWRDFCMKSSFFKRRVIFFFCWLQPNTHSVNPLSTVARFHFHAYILVDSSQQGVFLTVSVHRNRTTVRNSERACLKRNADPMESAEPLSRNVASLSTPVMGDGFLTHPECCKCILLLSISIVLPMTWWIARNWITASVFSLLCCRNKLSGSAGRTHV